MRGLAKVVPNFPITLFFFEAKALADNRALRASGRRQTHADMPAFRVRGPLLFEAEGFGIPFIRKRQIPNEDEVVADDCGEIVVDDVEIDIVLAGPVVKNDVELDVLLAPSSLPADYSALDVENDVLLT